MRQRTAKQIVRQKQVYELWVIDGWTVRQIAAELQISLETVIADRNAEEARLGEDSQS